MDQRVRNIGLELLREVPLIEELSEYHEDPLFAEITERLTHTLPISASATRKKCNYYPNTRDPIDILVQISDGPIIWIECKCAWKSWFGDSGKVNTFYKKHLLHEDRKEHSALTDILYKLPRIASVGDYVGEIVIGFDSDTFPMDPEIVELTSKCKLAKHPWETFHVRWPDSRHSGYSFGVWFWVRPVLPAS